MKKIIIFFLVLVVGKGFGQGTDISPFPTDGTFNVANFGATNFTRTSTDWNVQAPGILAACTVTGSSAGNFLAGYNGVAAGTVVRVMSPAINTSSFVNIQVSWNAIRAAVTSPSVTFEWSNNNGSTWNAISYSGPPVTNTWAAIAPINLPASANGTVITLRWSYTSVGSFTSTIALDDVKVTGTPSPAYYWDGVGALHQTTSWFTSPGGVGSNPPNFSNSFQNFYLQTGGSATLSAAWAISGANSVLNVGDGTSNNFRLTIPSSFGLSFSGGAVVNVRNSSTLTILNNSFPAESDVVLGGSSTVEFAQNSPVSLWSGTTFGNLTLSGTGDKNQSGDLTVLGTFNISSATNYIMAPNPFFYTTLSGNIVCNGTITPDGSNLTINGPSVNPIGTINFDAGGSINSFSLDRPTQTLTLGGDISFGGGFFSQGATFANGDFNINGRLVDFMGAITFPASSSNGSWIGSTTSSVVISGSGAISNNLIMSQANATARTLNLVLNRSSSTLVLGNSLDLQAASFSNGNLNINGQALNLTGPTTFPTSVSNGYLIGSTTSALLITGSGLNTNAMLMDQSSSNSRSLGTFSLSRGSSTVSLGNNLIVSSNATFANGVLNLNGTHLTLEGAITFPINALGRGFLGSITSSLTINGSASISGSLQMVSANNRLDEFTMNRSSTFPLANTLEIFGSVYPNAGTIASNGNLFIRSNATQKGRIAEVMSGASITGNVRVETFAAGGTTDWTNLGVSGVQGRTLANWDGQIPMSCSGCINSETSAGGYFVSVQAWDETAAASSSLAYVEQTGSSALTPGKGFWVYLGNNIGTTSDITWIVTGSVVTGPVTVPLSYSGPTAGDGFNLVSNPFPAPISWNAAINSNFSNIANLYGAIYTYNPDFGGTGSYVYGAGSGSGGVSDVIPMGQGFYTQVGATTTFTFQESNKVKSNAPLLKTTEVDYGSIVNLKVSGGGYSDATAIRFHSDATADFDRLLDAHKLYSSPGYVGYPGIWTQRTTISTLSNDKDYSVNSLPYAQSADAIIPVLVKVYASGQHTITGTDLENLPNSCVELKDKLLNVTHNLKSGGYVCNISDTTTTPRFELRICMDVAMSVDENKSLATDNSIVINNDENGMYVKFDYKQATKSKISVTNVLGQKIIDDKSLTTINDKVYLNLDAKQQIVFITVSNENQRVSKKVVR